MTTSKRTYAIWFQNDHMAIKHRDRPVVTHSYEDYIYGLNGYPEAAERYPGYILSAISEWHAKRIMAAITNQLQIHS